MAELSVREWLRMTHPYFELEESRDAARVRLRLIGERDASSAVRS